MSTARTGLKRRLRQGVAAAVIAAGSVLISPAADAMAATAPAPRDGYCDSGEFCLYYFSGYAGSVSDFAGGTNIPNYGSTQPGCYDFKGAGDGKGKCVKNNAQSVWNRTNKAVRVYFNSNYAGASQLFNPGQFANLNSTLSDNNASHRFF